MKAKLNLIVLNYFRILAKIQLAKVKLLNPRLKIIGITGSAGKTSAINACQAVLSSQYRVKTTAGSNSESGIPLNILNIKPDGFSPIHWLKYATLAAISLLTNWQVYDVYLVEMGIDSPSEPKNMGYLLKIISPDIGIFLNVNSVHLQFFDSLDQIAKEKAKLVNAAPIAIINTADPLVTKYTQNPNPIPISPQTITIPNTILPSAFSVTFGAAITLASLFDIPHEQAVRNLQTNFRLAPGRSSLFKGINHSQIIDSTYNSSPLAASEMLRLLSSYPKPRVAILGDMRELGKATPLEHRHLYETALKSANTVISVGPQTKKYFGTKALKFSFWWQAADYLHNHPQLTKNATILVKGSQNTIFLEELVKTLLLSSFDSSKLCRQSPYWLKLKKHFRQTNH